MDDNKRKALTDAGINLDTAMQRFFDDEEMFFSFLNKFLDDDLLEKLGHFIDEGNVKDAFDVAHTMKGVCANLSIDAINAVVNPMVDVLRKGSLEGLKEDYVKLKNVYAVVSKAIVENCQA